MDLDFPLNYSIITLDPVPRLDLADVESGYHGLIREDELTVEVKPTIRAIGAEVCGFRILNRHHGESPFEVSFSLSRDFFCCPSDPISLGDSLEKWSQSAYTIHNTWDPGYPYP